MDADSVSELLGKYLESQWIVAFERSGDFYASSLKIVSNGRRWAEKLGIVWDGSLIPESVMECIERHEEEENEG